MATTIENTTELAMKIRLSKQASKKLNKRAAENGRDVASIASELIERAIAQPSLEYLLAISQAEFASTGMTESELMDFDRELLGKVRSEKAPGA
jgi:predicted DNA-binding protein